MSYVHMIKLMTSATDATLINLIY